MVIQHVVLLCMVFSVQLLILGKQHHSWCCSLCAPLPNQGLGTVKRSVKRLECAIMEDKRQCFHVGMRTHDCLGSAGKTVGAIPDTSKQMIPSPVFCWTLMWNLFKSDRIFAHINSWQMMGNVCPNKFSWQDMQCSWEEAPSYPSHLQRWTGRT